MSLAALSVAVPLIVAALLAMPGKRCPRWIADVGGFGASLFVVVACGWLAWASRTQPLVYWFGGWTPRAGVAMGVSFVVDPFGAGLGLLSGVLVVLALLFAWRWFDTIGALFHVLMLVFLAALVGFGLTGDLFDMFVFFELMSATAFALCGYKSDEGGPLQGALNFAVSNTIGAFLALLGIGLLYARTGALNMAQMARGLGQTQDALVACALALVVCGFLVKAAAVPFHFWLADAHAVAPTPVSVLFSGVMVTAGVYAVARLLATVFAATGQVHGPEIRGVLLVVGTMTVLLGGVMCFAQRHLKRMLAFSTVAHVGIILVGVALLDTRGFAGAALYAVGHGLVKGSLFLSTGIVLHRLRSVDEVRLRGRGERAVMPLFVVGGLALAGVPPFGTYLGASMIGDAAREQGCGWVVAVIDAGAILTGGTVLRAAARIFLGYGASGEEVRNVGGETSEAPETPESGSRIAWAMLLSSATALVLAAVVGSWPGIREATIGSAERARDAAAWIAHVLDGKPVPDPAPVPVVPAARGLMEAVLVALGAAAFAWLVLTRERVPEAARRVLGTVVEGTVGSLRRVHTGRVGDYVTWLVLGVAGVAVACTALLR